MTKLPAVFKLREQCMLKSSACAGYDGSDCLFGE
jgi:hypothetical protein